MPKQSENENPHTPPTTTQGFNKGLWALAAGLAVMAAVAFVSIKLFLALI